jgi:hypothetical protein
MWNHASRLMIASARTMQTQAGRVSPTKLSTDVAAK